MHTLEPPNLELMKILTLSELRSRARTEDGKKITQAMFANMISRGRTTVIQWESGKNLDGVNTADVVAIASALNCRIEEVVAVIENTKQLIKEDKDEG